MSRAAKSACSSTESGPKGSSPVPVARKKISLTVSGIGWISLAKGAEFTIPIRRPEQTADLDHQSMRTWMVEEGFFSERLHWYVDYGCRDDYGAVLFLRYPPGPVFTISPPAQRMISACSRGRRATAGSSVGCLRGSVDSCERGRLCGEFES